MGALFTANHETRKTRMRMKMNTLVALHKYDDDVTDDFFNTSSGIYTDISYAETPQRLMLAEFRVNDFRLQIEKGAFKKKANESHS